VRNYTAEQKARWAQQAKERRARRNADKEQKDKQAGVDALSDALDRASVRADKGTALQANKGGASAQSARQEDKVPGAAALSRRHAAKRKSMASAAAPAAVGEKTRHEGSAASPPKTSTLPITQVSKSRRAAAARATEKIVANGSQAVQAVQAAQAAQAAHTIQAAQAAQVAQAVQAAQASQAAQAAQAAHTIQADRGADGTRGHAQDIPDLGGLAGQPGPVEVSVESVWVENYGMLIPRPDGRVDYGVGKKALRDVMSWVYGI